MPRSTIFLKNVTSPLSPVIIRDLNEAIVVNTSLVEISDTNTYDEIISSKSLYEAIDGGKILLVIDGVEFNEDFSIRFMTIYSRSLVSYITKIVIKDLGELLAHSPADINDRIELGNYIYEFDSYLFDLEQYTLFTNTDTAVHGYSQAINKIISSRNDISVITSTGNLFITQIEIGATGNNSQCIEMNGTGSESLDMQYVAFSSGSKYGTLTSIRQGFWTDGFSFGASDGFSLGGTWTGGFTLNNSRIINTSGAILKGLPGLTLNTIRSNVNATIPANSFAFDFDFDNFNLDQGFQIEGARINGDGLFCSQFTGATDNVDAEKSRKSYFKGNTGNLSKNTRVGGLWKTTVEVVTPLVQNTPSKLLGTTIYSNMVHVGPNGFNSFVHAQENVGTYEVDGEINLDAANGNDITLIVNKFIAATSTNVIVGEYTKRVINSVGGQDEVSFRPFVPIVELAENDRIEILTTNLSGNQNVSKKIGSFLKIKGID